MRAYRSGCRHIEGFEGRSGLQYISMAKRNRAPEDDGLKEGRRSGRQRIGSELDTRREGMRSKKREKTKDNQRAALKGKRQVLQTGPTNSPHRRKKSLSSLESPAPARRGGSVDHQVEERGIKTTQKRPRTKDLGLEFEAAATNAQDKVDFQINSDSHNRRVVITSPAKRTRPTINFPAAEQNEEEDLAAGRRRLSYRGGQRQQPETQSDSNQVSIRAADNVLLPTADGQAPVRTEIRELVRTEIRQLVPCPQVATPLEEVRVSPTGQADGIKPSIVPPGQSSEQSGHADGAQATTVALGESVRTPADTNGGSAGMNPQGVAVPPLSEADRRLAQNDAQGDCFSPQQTIAEVMPARVSKEVAQSISPGTPATTHPSIINSKLSDSVLTVFPSIPPIVHAPAIEFPGFPETVESGKCEDRRSVDSNPSPKSPKSTIPELRTPAYSIDRGCVASLASQPTVKVSDQLAHSVDKPTGRTPTFANFVPTSPRTPSSPTLQSSPLQSLSSPPLVCSIRAQKFIRSPVRNAVASTRPPRSPQSVSRATENDAPPQGVCPSIANRMLRNSPPVESLQTLLVKSSVRMLLRTLPVDQRASFIETNDKVSITRLLHFLFSPIQF